MTAPTTVTSAGHVHRFRLEEPNGPTAIGTCPCGESREMWNTHASDRDENWRKAASWRTRSRKLAAS